MKRLALYFDGTWNDPEDNTNVWRLRLLTAHKDRHDVPQMAYYDAGVGTSWYDRLRGGATGQGLSKNIGQAYQWLMEHYEDGDEVFLFGFSRGAYTARSLAGFVSRCGLMRPGSPLSTGQLFERYRKGDAVRSIEAVFADARLGRNHLSREERWMMDYSRRHANLIRFVGVWDTVGALGIPHAPVHAWSRRAAEFHNTRLSDVVEHCYQALALDEHRREYDATLWTRLVARPEADADPWREPAARQVVEQRWFVGAHANVGGGYRDDPLGQIPLAWLQQKAKACGLAFRLDVALAGDEWQADPADSYASFLRGAYKVARRRFHRLVEGDPRPAAGGTEEALREVIDPSVFERCRARSDYRPASLVEWACRRRDTTLEALLERPELWTAA